MKIELLLNPLLEQKIKQRRVVDVYSQAITEAQNLYILSAFLTDWSPQAKLNPKCEDLCFIVGTDFGLTSKDACRSVLKWLPKRLKCDLLAAEGIGGFHPKLLMWRTGKGEYRLLLGSSNLTTAAFETNHEANVLLDISSDTFEEIRNWIDTIRDNCRPVNEDWLKEYKEAIKRGVGKGQRKNKELKPFLLAAPSRKDINSRIPYRRAKQRAFAKIAPQLRRAIAQCANGKIGDSRFYTGMIEIWGHHTSRFMGRGFEIIGKGAKWHQACRSLEIILDKSEKIKPPALDTIVRAEKDSLAKMHNSVRRSWLSEMLCHFFPESYPLIDKPVTAWLRHNKYHPPRGASEGAKYLHLARQMREVVKRKQNPNIRNLVELDFAIWADTLIRKGESLTDYDQYNLP